MKKALETNSISLLPGGMREMLYKDTTILSKRRGIFKLSLETGVPLVPVLSKGEAELCKILELPECIQNFMKYFDACLPIPTLTSVIKFLGISKNPLKDSIYTVIGEPIEVQKVEEPSEQQILDLKQKYIESLKEMYKKEMGRDLKII
jgi:2-acylglycerol O-acyltransferase 2